MANNYKIETERLILRRWCDCDAKALVEGLGNFEVAKNLTVPFPYTIKEAKQFLSRCNSNPIDFYFAITLKENNKVIGGTSIELSRGAHGGIWLNEKYIGKGFGTEAWIARAKFAFEELHLNELENGFFDFNNRSWHMQQKLGYKIVGEKENYSPALNKKVKEIVTLLTKEDFKFLLRSVMYV